jgi:Trp operon repressor
MINSINWQYYVVEQIQQKLNQEQIRHLCQRLAALLTPEQRELLIARIQLIHTSGSEFRRLA